MTDAWALIGASIPIITLIALLAFRVRPLSAIAVAVLVLLGMGIWFPVGGVEFASLSGRLVNVTVNVSLILLGGLVLSVLSADSGAQHRMSGWLAKATKSPERAVLLYGLGVTAFMDGIVGWGVSIIVVLPLLMRTGLNGTRAATVTMLGHFVGPWGSLGPGLLVTSELGRVDIVELGTAAAWYNIPVVISAGVAIAIVGVGRRMTVSLWIELFIAISIFVACSVLVSRHVSPSLTGALAPLAVIVLFLLVARAHGAVATISNAELRTFGPFAVLLGAMLAMVSMKQLMSPSVAAVLTSPGLWLIVAAATAPAFFSMQRAELWPSVVRGLKSWIPVTVMTLLYILFGILLTANGMSGVLANAAASSGPVFIVILPFVSWIAGYLTASNTAVSTMLTTGVAEAAAAVGASPTTALGVLLASAGSAGGAAPSRIALAVSIAQSDRETNFGKISLILIAVTLTAVTVLAASLTFLPR